MPNQALLSSNTTYASIYGVFPLSIRRPLPLFAEKRKWVKALVLNIVGLFVLAIYLSWVGFFSVRKNELPLQLLSVPRPAYLLFFILWLCLVYIFNECMFIAMRPLLLQLTCSIEEQP
jgi:hypothetical protein